MHRAHCITTMLSYTNASMVNENSSYVNNDIGPLTWMVSFVWNERCEWFLWGRGAVSMIERENYYYFNRIRFFSNDQHVYMCAYVSKVWMVTVIRPSSLLTVKREKRRNEWKWMQLIHKHGYFNCINDCLVWHNIWLDCILRTKRTI